MSRCQHQRFALALEVAQHRVDESPREGITLRSDADRFVDRGISRREFGIEFVQANQQMPGQFDRLQRTLGESGEEEAQAAGFAQNTVGQVLRGSDVAAVKSTVAG